MPQNQDVAVEIADIHKEFVLPVNKNSTLKQAVVNIVKRNNKTINKVLDGVSFDVFKGDFLGIIGRNGSGKSTLLKLIAGVYEPTVGNISVHGGLTPFIELGVGFNPELSGRDNVFLNGALLGFNRKQMVAMYDEIVDFAEIEPFMDQKLKNYSSGMQVRLAFSIAIKAKNDILIFDEVLAVGDEAFQRKCLDVFERYKAEGQTVILVTHSMETVRRFCNRVVLLNDGKVMKIGDPQSVAEQYSKLNQVASFNDLNKKTTAPGDYSINLKMLSKGDNQDERCFNTGQDVVLALEWGINPNVADIMVDIFKMSGEHLTGFKASHDGFSVNGTNKAFVRLSMLFGPGRYYFTLSLRAKDDSVLFLVSDVHQFDIVEDWKMAGNVWSGLTYVKHKWLNNNDQKATKK